MSHSSVVNPKTHAVASGQYVPYLGAICAQPWQVVFLCHWPPTWSIALPMASVSVVANAQKSVIYGHYWLTRTFGLPLSNEATLAGLSHVFRVRKFERAALEVRRLFNMVDNFHVYLWGAELSTVRASALSQRQWVASQALRQFGGSIHVATFGS